MGVGDLMLGLVGAVVGAVVPLFVFTRKLVTRDEMDDAIKTAVQPLKDRTDRTEHLLEQVRQEMAGVRIQLTRLATLVERHNGRSD